MSGRIAWAYFRRWLYLLFGGMWRGEQGSTLYLLNGEVNNITAVKRVGREYHVTRIFYFSPTP